MWFWLNYLQKKKYILWNNRIYDTQNNYDKSIDVWSLGILLYELIHVILLLEQLNKKHNDNEIIENIKIYNLQFDKFISNECNELIKGLLFEDVIKRFKIEEIFKYKIVKIWKIKFNFPEKKNNEKIINNNKSKFVIINEKNNILNSKKNIKSWIIKTTKFKYIIRFWKSKFK